MSNSTSFALGKKSRGRSNLYSKKSEGEKNVFLLITFLKCEKVDQKVNHTERFSRKIYKSRAPSQIPRINTSVPSRHCKDIQIKRGFFFLLTGFINEKNAVKQATDSIKQYNSTECNQKVIDFRCKWKIRLRTRKGL